MRAATYTTVCVIVATSLRLSSALSEQSSTDRRLAPLLRKGANPDRRKLRHVFEQSDPHSSDRVQNSISNIIPKGECIDNASYISKIGFTCQTIRNGGLKCDGFVGSGFSSAETQELKMACPNACGLCTDSDSAIDPQSSVSSQSSTCFDGSCADDPSYVGKLNIDRFCEKVRAGPLNCKMFAVMSFTDVEIAELLAKCPCACNVECTASEAFSAMPTFAPTRKPTTASPSATPSTTPSAVPSTVPSTAPSTAPSTTPSAAPSTTPSASPPSGGPPLNPTAHSNAQSRSPAGGIDVGIRYDELNGTSSDELSDMPPRDEVRKSNGVVDPLNHLDVSNANASPKANIVVSSIVLTSAVVALFIFL